VRELGWIEELFLRPADGAVYVAIPDRAATVGERVCNFLQKVIAVAKAKRSSSEWDLVQLSVGQGERHGGGLVEEGELRADGADIASTRSTPYVWTCPLRTPGAFV